MNHSPSHDQISAYVDDRLSPEERAEVEALLQNSAEARAELESYRQLRAALRSLPVASAPADLMSRVMAQAEQESLHGKPTVAVAAAMPGSGSLRRRWTIPVVSAVASLGLLLFVTLQLQVRSSAPRGLDSADSTLASNAVPTYETGAVASDSESPITDGVQPGGGEAAESVERTLTLVDQIQFFQQGRSNSSMQMPPAYNISTAKVGDVIDAFQMQADGIAVVQLTVIDRQEVLDSIQLLLSDLNVPREQPASNTYGAQTNDFYAVYVEADKGQLEALLKKLQENMGIEEMYVSASIPSAELNPFIAAQGYDDVWELPNEDRGGVDGSRSNLTRMSVPPQPALRETFTAPKAAASNEYKRSVNQPEAKDSVAEPDPQQAEQPRTMRRRSVIKSELPPPPPLPQQSASARDESIVAEKEAAPLEAAPLTSELEELRRYSYPQRQVELRFREEVGKSLIVQQPGQGQASVNNGAAANRAIDKKDLESNKNEKQLDFSKPFSSARSGFGGGGLADRPAARPAEPAAATPAPLPAPKDEPAEQDKRPLLEKKLSTRPLQVLFVLTTEPRLPATEASPPPPPAAETKP